MSLHPSVSQCALTGQGQGQISSVILGACLCRVQQRAKKSNYQPKAFFSVDLALGCGRSAFDYN